MFARSEHVARYGTKSRGPATAAVAIMVRWTMHVLMAIALLGCLGSLVHTALIRSVPCPLCGGRMGYIATMHSVTRNRSTWATMYHCDPCEYGLIVPGN
jgi:hypothetical protein